MSVYLNQKLSAQALYQQKLKQGVYHAPGMPTVGVNSAASDTAALLAASSDLTVKPSYERTVAAEAHTAALAAKSKPEGKTEPQARAPGIGLGVPSFKGSSVYAAASRNSTMSMTSRTDPERDYRSGLAPKAADASLNIHKINEMATKNSSKSLNDRFNPELDYRSGLKQKPTEYLTQEEEDLAADGATASLKHGAGASDTASTKTRTQSFKASDVVGSTLLSAANARAQERLQTLNLEPANFKAQAQAYAHALALAQKNSNERMKRNAAGEVDLGGGLTMTIAELNAMAALVVQPVLGDISTKASAQRDLDEVAKQKQAELTKKHQESKQEEVERKLKEKQDLERAKKERLDANEQKKEQERNLYAEYQVEKETELTDKVKELKEKEQEYATEKETLLAEKTDNQTRIDEEEQGKIAERKTELEEMQAEKDEILQPILDELEEESSKLKQVTEARDHLREEVSAGEAQEKEYTDKIAELKEKLQKTSDEVTQYTTDLEESTTKAEHTSKEVDELHQQLASELKQAEDAHKELDGEIAKLETEKKDHLETKKSQKALILKNLDEKVKEEHAINAELPEHMRKDVNEKKLRDVGDLFAGDTTEVPLVSNKPAKAAAASKPAAKDAAPAAKAAAPKSPAKKEKQSGLKRITKYFSTKPPPAKQTKPAPAAKPAKQQLAASEASNGDYDDISLGANKNKGGVFKEEI